MTFGLTALWRIAPLAFFDDFAMGIDFLFTTVDFFAAIAVFLVPTGAFFPTGFFAVAGFLLEVGFSAEDAGLLGRDVGLPPASC